MRIGIVRTTLHKGSGQTVHIMQLAQRLEKKGHEVTIFCRKFTGDTNLDIITAKVPFGKIPFIRHFSTIMSLKKLISSLKIDIIHTQYHPGLFVGNYTHKSLNLPHVFTFHGFAPLRGWNNPLQSLKMADHRIGTFFGLRLGVDFVITVSKYLRMQLIRRYLYPESCIEVVYNGVDLNRFNPSVDGTSIRQMLNLKDEHILLYLGRLASYKGTHFLLKAAPHILKEYPDTKLLIAGAARYDTPELAHLVKKTGIKRSIIFTGYIPNSMLAKLYACCDVFCFPSLWEGFGLPLAEAQATGKPIVAFKTCAIPEVVIDKETGFLVEPGNVKGIYRAVVRLLSDKQLRNKMGERGRRRVEKIFSWDSAVEKTIQIYKKTLRNHNNHKKKR